MVRETFFVDANVPMYAEGGEHPYKTACARVLDRIVKEDLPAYTSAEIVQEILHRYFSLARPQRSRQMVEDFVTIVPHVLPITRENVLRAARLSIDYPSLRARDLLHVAVMLHHGIGNILSTDIHFDGIPLVHRIDPITF